MKTAVSIPDPVFRNAEALASRLGVSRSQLYAQALAALVELHREDLVTERLNAVYGGEAGNAGLDAESAALQRASVEGGRW